MSLARVMFDTNAGSHEHGYWLGFERSRRELENLGGDLEDGAEVIIYMENELELHATLRFDAAENVWWAQPVPGTITYLDGST